MSPAQKSALKWLRNRNGEGCFDRNGVLLAGGQRAPVMRSTWNKLASHGMVDEPSKGRLAVTPHGLSQDLNGVAESSPDPDGDFE